MKKLVESVLLYLNGKNFKCECGSNVFTKYENNIYKCHCCGNIYEGSDDE